LSCKRGIVSGTIVIDGLAATRDRRDRALTPARSKELTAIDNDGRDALSSTLLPPAWQKA
jgi:hypothetical protein